MSNDPPQNSGRAPNDIEQLDAAECWRLVETSTVGRLVVGSVEGRPGIFPVNFLTHDGNLYIRTAPGTKMQRLVERPTVVFEVDGSDADSHWSVILEADAERVDDPDEIDASGIRHLQTVSATPKHQFFRLSPVGVTGRRFRFAPEQASAEDEIGEFRAPPAPSAGHTAPKVFRPSTQENPSPIPHYPPLSH